MYFPFINGSYFPVGITGVNNLLLLPILIARQILAVGPKPTSLAARRKKGLGEATTPKKAPDLGLKEGVYNRG
jgi:hypothetical protein